MNLPFTVDFPLLWTQSLRISWQEVSYMACLPNKKGWVGYNYTPVDQHSNGNHPFPIGNTSTNAGFSMSMLHYWRVIVIGPLKIFIFECNILILQPASWLFWRLSSESEFFFFPFDPPFERIFLRLSSPPKFNIRT